VKIRRKKTLDTGPLTEQEFYELADYNGRINRGDRPDDPALVERMAELQERWNRWVREEWRP
jgi:hypothetical protein